MTTPQLCLCYRERRGKGGEGRGGRKGYFCLFPPLHIPYSNRNMQCYAMKVRALVSVPSDCCFPLTAYGLV